VNNYANVTGEENASVAQFDSFMAYSYGGSWTSQNLTFEQKSALWEFVLHGYSARKASPAEYVEFLANASAVNSNQLTCDYYDVAAYRDGFAGYVLVSPKRDKSVLCETVPVDRCSGGVVIPFINDLGNPSPPEATPGVGGTMPSATATPPENPDSGNWLPEFFPFAGQAASTYAGENGARNNSTANAGAGGSNALRDAAVGGVVVLVLAAFGAYIVITRRPEQEMGVSEAELHRALSSETRVALMKELMQRDLTPTDLSTKVGKSKATVVEHLDRLRDNGFVEKKEEEGKKFVFYGLTRKGKEVLRRAG
jgi:DNA-binding transcriptional ArsR family regulator